MDAIIYKDTIYSGGGAMRGNYFNPIIYSAEEREVGVWTDNKPLYQKTIPITKTSTATLVDISSLDIDTLVDCTGVEYPNDKSFFLTLNYHENSNWYCFLEVVGTDLGVYCSDRDYNGAPNVLATIQYTKTTDVAGSGKYNTLGVPNVHYTTDEQVIGTWLGETLYRKIVSFDNVTINANGFASYQLSQYINNLSHAIFHKTVAITTGGYSELPSVHVGEISGYAWSSALNNNELYISRGNASGVTADYKVIVEYTKTS